MEKKNRIGWSWCGVKAIWATSPKKLGGFRSRAARRRKSGRTIFRTCLESSNGDDWSSHFSRWILNCDYRMKKVNRLPLSGLALFVLCSDLTAAEDPGESPLRGYYRFPAI